MGLPKQHTALAWFRSVLFIVALTAFSTNSFALTKNSAYPNRATLFPQLAPPPFAPTRYYGSNLLGTSGYPVDALTFQLGEMDGDRVNIEMLELSSSGYQPENDAPDASFLRRMAGWSGDTWTRNVRQREQIEIVIHRTDEEEPPQR